jgi:polyisoprenoid-binding protein YceI
MRTTLNAVRYRRFALAVMAALPLRMAAQDTASPSAALISGTLGFKGHAIGGRDFTGRTSEVKAEVFGGIETLSGSVEAPAATLTTRNMWRDRDLRLSLETDRYPSIRLDISGATVKSARASGDTLNLEVHGQLTIHGVTHPVHLPVVVVRRADIMYVTAVFPVDLVDYHIGGLTKMFGLLRMERQIEVQVKLRFACMEDWP